MTAPGARPKFRIDPTAPPAPPPPVPAAPPSPALPSPSRSPLPSPSRSALSAKKKWIVGGAIVAALLLIGGAYAVFGLGVGGFVYPTKYLLTKTEAPHGLTLADASQASQQTPCDKTENPCQVNADTLDQMAMPDQTKPKEAWVEGFDTPSTRSSPLTIIAMKFASNKEADDWAGTAVSACGLGQGHGALLQDGDVVVLVSASDNGANVYKDKVVTALRTKASGLRVLCSR